MTTVLDSLVRALRDLFQPRVLWVVIWPMLAAGLLWLVLAVTFWTTFSGWIALGLDKLGIQTWLTGLEPVWIANGIQALLHVLFYVPLVYLTALVITALFGMTALIRIVAERHYPELKRENGGSFVGSLWNALIAMIVYLNQRLFRYDAIAEHASAAEMAALFKNARSGWWGLGVLTGLVQFVPLLNLLGPVFAALAFIHYGLARLDQQRSVA
ncbi:EI24 domain-containing protein [Thiobacillus sp.]|uniref:EI24 domain-containing protein n=1 Tax=Thiobacillus sp. TaxID=924 RepID=UPI001DC184F1|nr:EI24 domain-containing protein [Thiobacillus sp.]MBC2760339.1 EI24 domain-containing protein [Thiobacillus sp.]